MKILTNSDLKFIEREILLLAEFNSSLDIDNTNDKIIIDSNVARIEELERIVNASFKELAKPKVVKMYN